VSVVVLLLSALHDFVTDPFSWVGIGSLIVSKRPSVLRYRRLLLWIGWVCCGVAVFNIIAQLVRDRS
jgi:hypothetical protein